MYVGCGGSRKSGQDQWGARGWEGSAADRHIFLLNLQRIEIMILFCVGIRVGINMWSCAFISHLPYNIILCILGIKNKHLSYIAPTINQKKKKKEHIALFRFHLKVLICHITWLSLYSLNQIINDMPKGSKSRFFLGQWYVRDLVFFWSKWEIEFDHFCWSVLWALLEVSPYWITICTLSRKRKKSIFK